MKYLTLAFLTGGLALPLQGSPTAPGDTGMNFERATVILTQTLANAGRVEIYEGLPREQKAFDREKQAAICRQITDQWFYGLSQDMRLKHIVKLQHMAEGGLFQPWRGGKLGGGFHADFAISVTNPKNTTYVLFCFGCHEARIIREGNPFAADLNTADFRVTTDLNDKVFAELQSLLTGYRDPERASPPSGG